MQSDDNEARAPSLPTHHNVIAVPDDPEASAIQWTPHKVVIQLRSTEEMFRIMLEPWENGNLRVGLFLNGHWTQPVFLHVFSSEHAVCEAICGVPVCDWGRSRESARLFIMAVLRYKWPMFWRTLNLSEHCDLV